MIYNLTLGRHQLAIKIGRKPGRPRKSLVIRAEEFISYLLKLAHDHRYPGHRISRVLRYLFESKKAKKVLGFNLAATILFTGIAGSPISAFSGDPQIEMTTLSSTIVELTTNHSVRIPLDSFEVTQGYHLLHRAVDLNGELGEPVFSIMDGTVETIFYSRFSYGNYLVINHGSGFKSLYAHLGKIVVGKDEEVDKNTVIGTIGSTGLATGTHLHLEVYDNDRPFNPLTILK